MSAIRFLIPFVAASILPGVALFRELTAEVKRLTQRVEALEAKLQDGDASGTAGEMPKAAVTEE